MGVLRRWVREDFPEEVTPKLRTEAGGGISGAMGRKAKANLEEPSKTWEGVWNFIRGLWKPSVGFKKGWVT